MLGSTGHCLWLCLLIVNLVQPCQAQSNNNINRYNNNNDKDNSQATTVGKKKQTNLPPTKSLYPHYLILFDQKNKKNFDDTRTTPDKVGNELKKETSLKYKTEKNNSDGMKKGFLGKYLHEMESSNEGSSVLKGKESFKEKKLPEENAEKKETPKKDLSYKKLSIKDWSKKNPTKLWSVKIAIKPLNLKSLSRFKRNPKSENLKQTTKKEAKKTKLNSMNKQQNQKTLNLNATAELNNKNSPTKKRLLLRDEGIVSLNNKNPLQPNGAIEQEVMIINRPQSLRSIDHFIKHIRQHMFNHYDSGIMRHRMHHGIGMHHNRRSHAGHVLVDHSVHHWPWHMSIQEENLHGWHHLCHGAMVGHRSVLTNAECVYNKPLPSLRVIRHNLIDKVITLDNSSFITARIIHPKYKDYIDHFHKRSFGRHPGRHNLAMLHLGHEMGVHPIGLHGLSHAWHGHYPGHCSTSHSSVQFITNRECDYHVRNEHIGNTHLCTYGLPCGIHNSHGFPLVCYNRGHPYLAGLSSYQSGCGGHHHPTVYERIAPHNDWITNHIQ